MTYDVKPGDVIAMIDGARGGDIQTICTTMTTDLAQALLDRYSPHRRPLQQQIVGRIARGIEHPDPEGNIYEEISVAPDGRTIGGQHLLTAVLQAGKPAEAVRIIFNRPPMSGFPCDDFEQNGILVLTLEEGAEFLAKRSANLT